MKRAWIRQMGVVLAAILAVHLLFDALGLHEPHKPARWIFEIAMWAMWAGIFTVLGGRRTVMSAEAPPVTRTTAAAALACVLAACGVPPAPPAPAGSTSAPNAVLAACVSGGGYPLGERAAACQGTFAGTLEAQCRPGWSPCTRSPLDAASCASFPGFFTGARSASTTCHDALNVLLGCGEVGTIPSACSAGFTRRVQCPGTRVDPNPFSCQGWTVRNEDPRSGVLCCAGSAP